MNEVVLSDEAIDVLLVHYQDKLKAAQAEVEKMQKLITGLTGKAPVAPAKAAAPQPKVVQQRQRIEQAANRPEQRSSNNGHGRVGGREMFSGHSTHDTRPLKEWISFIMEALESEDRPLTTQQILDVAAVKLELSDSAKLKGKASIARALHKLANKNNTIVKYPIIGKRGYNYCLPNWFNENGTLLPEYAEKAN